MKYLYVCVNRRRSLTYEQNFKCASAPSAFFKSWKCSFLFCKPQLSICLTRRKEPNSTVSNSIEARLRLVAEFLESEFLLVSSCVFYVIIFNIYLPVCLHIGPHHTSSGPLFPFELTDPFITDVLYYTTVRTNLSVLFIRGLQI